MSTIQTIALLCVAYGLAGAVMTTMFAVVFDLMESTAVRVVVVTCAAVMVVPALLALTSTVLGS